MNYFAFFLLCSILIIFGLIIWVEIEANRPIPVSKPNAQNLFADALQVLQTGEAVDRRQTGGK